jgi:lipopolysaccharide transport system permease protein
LGLLFVFVLLKQAGVVTPRAGGVAYVVFAGVGVIHWALFSGLLTQAAGSLVSASNLVARARFPREVLVLAACARVLVDWLFGLLVLAGLFAWAGVMPAWTVVFAPVALLPLLLLGIGLGLFLALAALPIRDILQALPLLLAPMLFLSPVFYELPAGGTWAWVRILNPVAASFEALRGLTFDGAIPDPQLFIFWLVLSLFAALGAWRIFNLVIPKIPEYAS